MYLSSIHVGSSGCCQTCTCKVNGNVKEEQNYCCLRYALFNVVVVVAVSVISVVVLSRYEHKMKKKKEEKNPDYDYKYAF